LRFRIRARSVVVNFPKGHPALKFEVADTAGFTDHMFALMHRLGYRFAPRIRDLADKKLYVPGNAKTYPAHALSV
jgi:TnpA family transposase